MIIIAKVKVGWSRRCFECKMHPANNRTNLAETNICIRYQTQKQKLILVTSAKGRLDNASEVGYGARNLN